MLAASSPLLFLQSEGILQDLPQPRQHFLGDAAAFLPPLLPPPFFSTATHRHVVAKKSTLKKALSSPLERRGFETTEREGEGEEEEEEEEEKSLFSIYLSPNARNLLK